MARKVRLVRVSENMTVEHPKTPTYFLQEDEKILSSVFDISGNYWVMNLVVEGEA